jgi:hypothetical protein
MLKQYKKTPRWVYDFTSTLEKLGEPELNAVALHSPSSIELNTTRNGYWSSWYDQPVYVPEIPKHKIVLWYGWQEKQEFEHVGEVKIYWIQKKKYKEIILFFYDAIRRNWFVIRCNAKNI